MKDIDASTSISPLSRACKYLTWPPWDCSTARVRSGWYRLRQKQITTRDLIFQSKQSSNTPITMPNNREKYVIYMKLLIPKTRGRWTSCG
ncbi:unnamed protein product [Nesidiocoris tenuis]|uniref:Uncharacterized protein n=1 Tax=Nesidiocoris tenuis TaxID=355587 RepID=A0A6H5HU35_9HEMI|nr:unnamed protein product [Nesidiocoris tenuis]